jgi:hypothetical protein
VKCPASVVRDHLRECRGTFDYDEIDTLGDLIARAADVRRPGPKVTLVAFLERLQKESAQFIAGSVNADGSASTRELRDAFVSTALLDPGDGKSVWAFIAANGATTRLQVATAELDSARTTERRLRRKRERAQQILDGVAKELTETRARIDRIEREISDLRWR